MRPMNLSNEVSMHMAHNAYYVSVVPFLRCCTRHLPATRGIQLPDPKYSLHRPGQYGLLAHCPIP